MSEYKTEQEQFWAGNFGDEYISRNQSDMLHAANLNLFSSILGRTKNICSVSEYGCNIGMNLKALKELIPHTDLYGFDINQEALNVLADTLPTVKTYRQSILEKIDLKVDLTFTKGVLIHINPKYLSRIYDNLYQNSRRYILIAEYYNPEPVSLSYRGHTDKLFKRDFAGELLDTYPDLRLVDYGFCYQRDQNFPQDDISWFLLEKI